MRLGRSRIRAGLVFGAVIGFAAAPAATDGRDGGTAAAAAAGSNSEKPEDAENAAATPEDDGIRREIEFSFTTKTE